VSWTETKVFEQLRHVFPSPAHVRIPAVRNGTGYARKRNRTADGIVFSVYPSRGLWMAGVEIKVSRSDWKKELADAEKADEISKYCHAWYVAAPVDVVPVNEVPLPWGLIECTAATAKIVKKPKHIAKPTPLDILLVASIFRSVESCVVPVGSVNERVKEAVTKATEAARSRVELELERLREVVKEFERTSGIRLDGYTWEAGSIGKAVALVREHGVDKIAHNLRREAERMKDLADRVLRDLAAAEPNPTANSLDDGEAAA
jgi:hypothetical protein